MYIINQPGASWCVFAYGPFSAGLGDGAGSRPASVTDPRCPAGPVSRAMSGAPLSLL